MEKRTQKPKLVYFQWDHRGSPNFLRLHTQLHVKCLSEFFEVTVINKDCDYQQICDIYQPDLTLFEGGFKTSFSKRLNIKGTSAYPEIPKLGFHNGDPWCDCRPGFLSEMERWGIETFFSISTTLAEHTPEIADNLFVWPNFIDNDIHKDYNQFKVVPILFNGSMISLYPWRQNIYNKVSNHFPLLTYPHLGYESKSHFMIYGEQYARTINASWVVPACGTVAKEVIRKHFEVPGCRSCLITERSPSLEAAGFVDMQNCVFANENDILDKLNYVFKNQSELERIINSGYNLVHSCHTLKQRDQIFQWFNLQKGLKSNEIIVQSNPFEPLSIVKKSSGIKSQPIKCNGIHLEFMAKGDEKFSSGEYNEAEVLYLKCVNFISSMSEPKLKLAICNLYIGRVDDAFQWLIQPIQYNLGIYGSFDPDPVEWAYYIILLLCQGKLNEAIIRASQFPSLSHLELNRTRWIVNYLQGKGDFKSLLDDTLIKSRKSIHILPKRSFSEWISNLSSMLKACQQVGFAEILNRALITNETVSENTCNQSGSNVIVYKSQLLQTRIRIIKVLNYIFKKLYIPVGRKGLPSISISDYIFRILKYLKFNSIKGPVNKLHLHLKALFNGKIDDFYNSVVYNIVRHEDVKSMIVIGSSDFEKVSPFFKDYKQKYPSLSVYHIGFRNNKPQKIRKKDAVFIDIKKYEVGLGLSQSYSLELNNCIKNIKDENEITHFDLVLIDQFKSKSNVEFTELLGAKFIIIKNINALSNFRGKQTLLSDPNYTMVSQNPLYGTGYVIFKKLNNAKMSNSVSNLLTKNKKPTF